MGKIRSSLMLVLVVTAASFVLAQSADTAPE